MKAKKRYGVYSVNLASLVKTKAHRVLGIDASTNSIAFCLMENDIPLKWGKIDLVGQDIYEKIYNAKLRMNMMLKELKSDYIAVEGAILVRSPDAVIKLSYVYGVVSESARARNGPGTRHAANHGASHCAGDHLAYP